jgi:hypothetical protein
MAFTMALPSLQYADGCIGKRKWAREIIVVSYTYFALFEQAANMGFYLIYPKMISFVFDLP